MANWTVAQKKAYIQDLLETNNRAVEKALLAIYARQTADEQAVGSTKHHNSMGFSGVDSEFLSSLAKSFQRYGSLTANQMKYARPKLKRYWKQLIEVSEANGKAPWQSQVPAPKPAPTQDCYDVRQQSCTAHEECDGEPCRWEEAPTQAEFPMAAQELEAQRLRSLGFH